MEQNYSHSFKFIPILKYNNSSSFLAKGCLKFNFVYCVGKTVIHPLILCYQFNLYPVVCVCSKRTTKTDRPTVSVSSFRIHLNIIKQYVVLANKANINFIFFPHFLCETFSSYTKKSFTIMGLTTTTYREK